MGNDNLFSSMKSEDDGFFGIDWNGVSRAHNSWEAMKTRCLVPTNKDYPYYGGRGITICPEWVTFEGFIKDMGPRPENTTIDRIDVNGNYEPGNCRWADHSTQQRNRRNCISVLVEGEKKSIYEVSEMVGFSPKTITWRVKKGCSEDEILSSIRLSSLEKNLRDYSDFIDQRFGFLKVIDVSRERDINNNYEVYFVCECICGSVKKVLVNNILSGKTNSCGCKGSPNTMRNPPKVGDVFSDWTVLDVTNRTSTNGITYVMCLCRCSCGVEKLVDAYSLKKGTSTSCGHAVNQVHGGASKNSVHAKEYTAWEGMKDRCYNPNKKGYSANGGIGVGVCEEWRSSFPAFLRDMGQKPEGTYLCRRDKNKDYSGDNCFWGKKSDLGYNTRARLIEHDGRVQSLTEWSIELGIHKNTLTKRLNIHGTLMPQHLSQ